MRKMILWCVGVTLFIALALAGVRWWVVAHLDFSGVGYPIASNPVKAAEMLDHLSQEINSGKVPSRVVNLASIGAPRQEAELLNLRRLLEDFQLAFDSPPRDAANLSRLLSLASLNSEQRRLVEKYSRECAILTFPQGSYLLNCDGWRAGNDGSALAESLDKRTERFYAISGHVFLYAPPYSSLAH